jgi:hypothetical protein
MTHFEYISVAVSIILGLGIIRILSNMSSILDAKKRYWLHVVWVFTVFWIIIQHWWAFWDFRNVEWNIGYFASLIVSVSALYILVLLLTDKQDPEQDWQSYYYSRNRAFFLGLLATGIYSIFITWLLLDATVWHTYRIFQVAMLTIALILSISRNESLHQLLTVAFVLLLVGSNYLFRFRPDLFS